MEYIASPVARMVNHYSESFKQEQEVQKHEVNLCDYMYVDEVLVIFDVRPIEVLL